MDLFNEKINDYSAVAIKLASPEEIRSWSYGEVRKPETINYRTYKPEKDGLFCERIFGPKNDWECFCGKYKGIKYKGVVCDRCGVEITLSRVRRKRMGHINLATPAAHIWFFKAIPSQLGTLLGMKNANIERVVYYQDYVVTEVKNPNCPLEVKQMLSEEQYRQYKETYVNDFSAEMGGSALKKILQNLDLEKLTKELHEALDKTGSKQKAKDISKRIKVVEKFIHSGNKPEWMILDVVPVIPAELRPLVLLESGNFATSDLNDLYRRLINRNNRLKKLMELNAPEVIIRNEKRMLQQSVDSLFDNSRCRRSVMGSNNRPLKSLSDMIKGKQGRFRENLLGKRVDYSARSVIVVGPDLKLNQCGLPKKIALELYQPFIIRRLKELGRADTIKSAKKMLDRKEEIVWDILDEQIKDHPVLLNRAPTLHRMSIQAFDPVLTEGNAIKVHPLVCAGFNADFDGDQMAVHLPLSWEAQIETRMLVMATNNIFSPAHGNPSISPSQDIVLGLNYLTISAFDKKGEGLVFSSPNEAIFMYDEGQIELHALIEVDLGQRKVKGKTGYDKPSKGKSIYKTTVGRLLLDEIVPEGMALYNKELDKKGVGALINDAFISISRKRMLGFLDALKELGFKYATLSGMSFAREDLKVPEEKQKIIDSTEKNVEKIQANYRKGLVTEGERYNQIIDLWTKAREMVGEAMMNNLKNDVRNGQPYLNPIYCMANSGARGSMDQVRQLAGMRGLMAKPSGEIIETPIKANFREGLNVIEFFSSTHGARKGLADTALKTADAGYLTRKLVDVAQNVIITCDDCGTLNGITKSILYKGDKVEVPLSQSIYGRVARDNIVDIVTDEVVVKENQLITKDVARRVEKLGFSKVRVRSPLTCEADRGICAKCYGMDLSRGKMVEEGAAVGIIAAQSIGEPGTQLTMRTFHIGGTASRTVEESQIVAKNKGFVTFENIKVAINQQKESVVLNRNGEIIINDKKGREIERYLIPAGAILYVNNNDKVKMNSLIVKWDPHNVPILAETDGFVRYEDIVLGETMREEIEEKVGITRKVIMEHKGDLHPQIVIEDKKGSIIAVYPLPERSYIEINEKAAVHPGTILAKTPREVTGTQDITGGLPRVTELLEARKPKEPSIISEIDGIVELGAKKRGKRAIIVKNIDSGLSKEHLVPYGKQLRVHKGDKVKAGEPLIEGPLVLQDILSISGQERLQEYLLGEIQNVYRTQGVGINDKHIEIIIAQMIRRVKVTSPGGTDLLPGSIFDKVEFKHINEAIRKKKGAPATATPQLLGITKASLRSDSFLAAASFQETTRVLTNAAIAGRRDDLNGLKENVILGHRVPVGTGYKKYIQNTRIKKKIIELEEDLNSEKVIV